MNNRESFGAWLKGQRERRGISLDAIAVKTKVSAAVYADMERGCLDRWPRGIFARAFIRGYAEAIGADADAVVEVFARLFPEAEVPRLKTDDKEMAAATPPVSLEAASAPAPMPLEPRSLRLFFEAGEGPSDASEPAPSARRLWVYSALHTVVVAGLAWAADLWLRPGAFWPVLAALALISCLAGPQLQRFRRDRVEPAEELALDLSEPRSFRRRPPEAPAPAAPRRAARRHRQRPRRSA